MYKYPYGDSQQLNLDWVLAKLKELEAAGLVLKLEEVSNALVSLTYNNSTAYRRYDYAFRNGKLYRCLTDTTGAFDPAAWQEALIGDDLAVLTRWINAIDAAAVVDVKFDTSSTNGKIQQKYHDQYHDVVEVDYTPIQNSKRPLSSNAGYKLKGALNDTQGMISVWDETGNSTASRYYAKGDYLIRNGYLYFAKTVIQQGETLSNNNLTSARIGEHLTSLEKYSEYAINNSANIRAIRKGAIVNFTGAVGIWRPDPNETDGTLQVSTNSGSTWITPQLAADFRPLFNIEIVDANTKKRITIQANGFFNSAEVTSNTGLRFSGCWLAANAL